MQKFTYTATQEWLRKYITFPLTLGSNRSVGHHKPFNFGYQRYNGGIPNCRHPANLEGNDPRRLVHK